MNEGTPIVVKKRKAQGHAHHGGSWKVAYADFVTAMMAFFMVMWIMGLSQETRAQIAGYFNDPLGFMKNEPKTRVNIQPPGGTPYSKPTQSGAQSNQEAKTEQDAAERLKEQIEESAHEDKNPEVQQVLKGLKLNITEEGLELEFTENTGVVFFDVGKSTIRPAAKALIARVAPVLARSGRKMLIDGHTDARQYPGSGYDNWDLSNDRATAIRRALRGGGVAETQILAVRAFGSTRLRNPADPYDFSNRRVTVLLPWLRSRESALSLPRDIVREQIEGAFRKEVGIAPE